MLKSAWTDPCILQGMGAEEGTAPAAWLSLKGAPPIVTESKASASLLLSVHLRRCGPCSAPPIVLHFSSFLIHR